MTEVKTYRTIVREIRAIEITREVWEDCRNQALKVLQGSAAVNGKRIPVTIPSMPGLELSFNYFHGHLCITEHREISGETTVVVEPRDYIIYNRQEFYVMDEVDFICTYEPVLGVSESDKQHAQMKQTLAIANEFNEQEIEALYEDLQVWAANREGI